MTVAPAADHVASRTTDGIDQAGSWIHGYGPNPTHPSTVLNTPLALAS